MGIQVMIWEGEVACGSSYIKELECHGSSLFQELRLGEDNTMSEHRHCLCELSWGPRLSLVRQISYTIRPHFVKNWKANEYYTHKYTYTYTYPGPGLGPGLGACM